VKKKKDKQAGICRSCQKIDENLTTYLVDVFGAPVNLLLCPICYQKLFDFSPEIFLDRIKP